MKHFHLFRFVRLTAMCSALIFNVFMGLAQTDPSSFCGPGTLWSETVQQCVPNPSVGISAYDGNSDGCVTVNDLLGLLGVFGECEPEGSTIYWFKYIGGWPYPNGDWTDESTDFYIMDCTIDSGYQMTTDLDLVMDFVLGSPDSLIWCGNDSLYAVNQVDSLEGVTAISTEDIPNGTMTFPANSSPLYLAIPQYFEENSLLLEQSFFDSASAGWVFPAQSRRAVTIYGELYWLYKFNAYNGMNVMCGY